MIIDRDSCCFQASWTVAVEKKTIVRLALNYSRIRWFFITFFRVHAENGSQAVLSWRKKSPGSFLSIS
jgi:hypothetical protein